MSIRSTIIGIVASALLLAVLGIARLFTISNETPDLKVRELEITTFTPPPPPPPPEEPPPDAPPPPPALTQVTSLPDPTRVPIPKADIPMDISVPVENFFSDLAPAPLPTAPKNVAPSRPSIAAPSPPSLPKKPSAPPLAKSHYNTSELDGIPRRIRTGSFAFPTELARKGITSVKVTAEVELSENGNLTLRRIISNPHPEIIPSIKRVISGSRFTPPKRNGQPVKAIFILPLQLDK